MFKTDTWSQFHQIGQLGGLFVAEYLKEFGELFLPAFTITTTFCSCNCCCCGHISIVPGFGLNEKFNLKFNCFSPIRNYRKKRVQKSLNNYNDPHLQIKNIPHWKVKKHIMVYNFCYGLVNN
jgi:hypothetical protein